ncbi:TMV resistance protein N [Capsicum baccatum]|uniref:TMV resistance protein N n=1 Tax=Capsicum baccatum TaxID=33114 RepID=A0A2G2VDZ1_CAPBA|nr:TMV resistance protein N [Capsicum baccatum]
MRLSGLQKNPEDDKRVEDGDSIPEELLKAIEVSQFAVAVFSKNFSTSRWCLNELVKIMECNKEDNGQTVIPIFYDVDPSHVRDQSGDIEKAFDEYELNTKDDVEGMQRVQRWRIGLTSAANLKGHDICDRNESEEIQQIVDHISSKLCKTGYSVLIVLDDIDHSGHLEYLAGDRCWFGNGSIVMITTRNRQLIENDDSVYEVSTLPDDEAMLLFNQHAFKKKIPDECCKSFSLKVVNHAKGLPLALKVWGSLFHWKDLTQWRRIVDKIKDKSTSEIVEKLKISYDGLEFEQQKMFLDMACFFRGYLKSHVLRILESYDKGAVLGLDVLNDKSLVFISGDDRLEMYDLIEDMGRYVVKMQKDLGEPSRIWDVEDFEEVMLNNTVSRLNNFELQPPGVHCKQPLTSP